MEQVDLSPLLEQLKDNIDDLQDALDPLLRSALTDTASKLPLLDKAKLYVLFTYAIESSIFCETSLPVDQQIADMTAVLRLTGTNARDHPVFRELTRVRQYFQKIQAAETMDQKRENLSLDKPATGRVIKHALVGR